MLPKTKKKTGGDLIALGPRQKDSQSGANNISNSGEVASATATALNMAFGQTVSSSNLTNSSQLSNNRQASSLSSATSTNLQQQPSQVSSGSEVTKNGNKTTSNNLNSNSNNSNYLDPKTIKDEINKLIEKDETEKLIKLIRLIVTNLKYPNPAASSNSTVKMLQPPAVAQQQPDLNFLFALSLVAVKRPELFLKQPTLVDLICTSLLFTSKHSNQQDKLNVANSSILKSKSIQMIRNSMNQTGSISSIQPAICQLLFKLFENESVWPDIFIKAYVDDSLGERSWVDNSACQEFVKNTLTAFCTKPLPFSVDTSTITSSTGNNLSSNNNEHLSSSVNNQNNPKFEPNSLTETNGSDELNIKFKLIPRYSSIRNEIEVLIVDMIKQFSNKQPPSQRLIGQSNLQPGALGSSMENKNFLKLLQNSCGICEVRALASSKLDAWLAVPKLTSTAQDLLMAVCVNVNCQLEQADKEIIAQVIKLKPKLKQHQHYYDCIRELIRNNPSNFETLIQLLVLNDLNMQQQHYLQYNNQLSQIQQQQQIPPNRNQHNLNIFQTTFSTDGRQASKILAEIMQKIFLQRNNEDLVRPLRSLLRDTIKNSRQDFDLIEFTHGLLNLSVPLIDLNQVQLRERYVNGICDLISVCVLVAITPNIKEAYMRRQHDTKDTLIKYYMLMAQIQRDTIIWLHDVVFNVYKVNSNFLINCMFKILFMVDKPEQCYSIDNWPSEQERGIMFKVVSEIPVLFETLLQVLMITKSLPDNMFMLMLCVEENLLKQAALVNNKDISSLHIKSMDNFIELLFSICLYTFQNPPTVSLAVTVLYWKAWQILLIIAALDPKGFGLVAWEKYPTLRLLMEMTMTEDYNFPPQSSICDEFTCEKYRTIEITASTNEKKEILEFENFFELKQSSKIIRTEMNSNLIDKVMKFDPTGQVRRPTNETIQNIKKLNSEYKLGQLLCKCRQPDFLLSLIKRQNSTLSLPWLSSLIESSSNDCLEIMPIQCICEFVWNMLGGVDEIQLKKQINIEQLIQRLRMILTTSSLNDSLKISQINDTFDYFLNKLSSEKQAVRIGSLKILQKLLTNEKIQLQPNLSPIQIDLKEIIESIKNLAAFNIYLQPLMIKHFRRALMVETNSCYLNVYICFIFEQLIDDYQQKSELESSLQMQIETTTESAESTPILIKNSSLKSTFNEIAVDLSSFFFSRPNLLDSIICGTSASSGQDEKKFYNYFTKFSSILINLNEYNIDECDENDNLNIKTLIRVNQTFDRNSTATNSFILIEMSPNHYTYIHEKIFNLVLYLVFFVIESTSLDSKRPGEYKVKELENLFRIEFFARFSQIRFMNCSIMSALNEKVKNKIFSLKIKPLSQIQPDNLSLKFVCEALESLIDSFSSEEISAENRLHQSLEYLLKRNGSSALSIHLMLKKIDFILKDNISKFDEIISNFCNITGYTVNYIVDLVELSEKKIKESQYSDAGQLLLSELKKIKEKFSLVKLPIRKPDNLFNDYESLFRLKNDFKPKQLDNDFSNKIDNELNQTSYSIDFLNTIQKQIDELKNKNINEENETQQMQVEESPDKQDLSDKLNDQLISKIIANSSNQNLETNLKNHLNTIESTIEKINLIADWLLSLENTEIQLSSKRNENFSKNQSVIVILLDYFCHLDPQVISADDPKQYQILFVSREKGNSSTMTQFFLLSLFIHQGDWQKLHSCVSYLLSQNLNEKIDPSIVLDFLSSLIHIPELWKGTESKVSQKYNEENILNLTENQIYRLIDFIVQEMCLSYAHKKDETQEKFSQTNELKFKLNKRVQLLKHFFKSFDSNKKQKEMLITKIIRHLDEQKHNFVSQNNNMLSEKFCTQIQNFFLYSIYLEENSIINHIKNPHRLFSNLYYQIDIPTKLDVIAHNLLNCFGEIEVNFSMNATSSGRIGVASSVTNFKKQEKLEIVAYAKKQEEFMMDANLVCIKLASSHPFIFIRQIPMMEGLLQGRVVYTYEEFKKRKFDKLFHYIIDLLNVLVPYVFHREYLLYIEPIISHYFDVFRSYCSENRDANGSLIQKFFEFLEKFINTDFQTGFNLIFKKYSSLISYLNKLYSDFSSIKFINAILTIPFELILNKNIPTNDVNDNSILTDQLISTSSVNIFNQKFLTSIWPTKQLEPFTSKLLNRENYDGVYSVLQEIDTVSQRQPVLLSHFIFQLQPLMLDINDNIRDCSISLIMRYLRLNPRDSSAFFQVYSECLISQDSKVFNSAIKILSDFIVLCSEKSNQLFRYALKGASKHNVDISKALSDSIRLLNLEKYVY